MTAFVTMHIGDILTNAIQVNEMNPSGKTNGGYVLMGVGVDDNGVYYPTRIISLIPCLKMYWINMT